MSRQLSQFFEQWEQLREELDKNACVLAVDDEASILEFFERYLIRNHIQVKTIASGDRALELIRREPFSLVLLDKNLPDISGLDLLARIKASAPMTEVILVTGYASVESALRAIELGAFDYWTKPLERLDVVLAKIRRAIRKQTRKLLSDRIVKDLTEHLKTSTDRSQLTSWIAQLKSRLDQIRSDLDQHRTVGLLAVESLTQVLVPRLRREGHVIFSTSLPSATLELLRQSPPAVLLVSTDIGNFNVSAFVTDAKKLCPDMEMIVLTEKADLNDMLALLERGAYDFVLDPTNRFDDIIVKLTRALREYRIQARYSRLIKELKRISESVAAQSQIGQWIDTELVTPESSLFQFSGPAAESAVTTSTQPTHSAGIPTTGDPLGGGSSLRDRTPRISLKTQVRLREIGHDEQTVFATLHDVSRGGVFVEMPSPMALGKKVMVEFFIDTDDKLSRVRGNGTVVRSVTASTTKSPIGVGIQFDQLDRMTLDAIESLYRQHQ